jgi:RNA-directed DNA polymerase
MTKQPLQKLFDAMYHGKSSFHDFLQSPVEQNYEVIKGSAYGGRTLFKPKEKLKTYHRFLNLFLFELLPINERVVFSYRKGFSAINAVEKHTQSKYFFQTDIKSFFDSIDRSLTKKTILAGAEFCPIEDLHERIDRIVDLVCVGGDSVPVGLPASAPISNAVLLNFDNEIERICKQLGLSYSRYADDIIISGQTQEHLSGLEMLVQEKLHQFSSEKFFIHDGKTRFFQVGGKIKILGMIILPNGKISVDAKRKNDIEVLLHFYLNNRERFNDKVDETKRRSERDAALTEEDYIAFLSGHINYIDSIDPDYTDKLRRKFGAKTIDMLKYSGFSKEK